MEIPGEKKNLLRLYNLKKETFLQHNEFDSGINASWAIALPYGETGYKRYEWYIPGLLEVYRAEDSGKLEKDMSLSEKFKTFGIDYAEQDLETFIKMLKHGLKIDLEKSPKACVKYEKDDDLSEIIVLVYEAESFLARTAGYKYRYFFIREEKGLGFYSAVAGNWNFIEGTKEELVKIVFKEKKVAAQFSFYLKWEWENA